MEGVLDWATRSWNGKIAGLQNKDAKRVNLLTIPTRWPIPSMKELMSKLSRDIAKTKGKLYFNSVDINSFFPML